MILLFGILVIDLFVRNNKEASMDAIHVIHYFFITLLEKILSLGVI